MHEAMIGGGANASRDVELDHQGFEYSLSVRGDDCLPDNVADSNNTDLSVSAAAAGSASASASGATFDEASIQELRESLRKNLRLHVASDAYDEEEGLDDSIYGYQTQNPQQEKWAADIAKKIRTTSNDTKEFKTPRHMTIVRIIAVGSIFCVAAILGAITFTSLQGLETANFETAYYSATSAMSSSIHQSIVAKVLAGTELALIFSHAFNQPDQRDCGARSTFPGRVIDAPWPNVTLSGFDDIVSKIAAMSRSRALSFNPLVWKRSLEAFNAYATDSQYLQTGYDAHETAWSISKGIYHIDPSSGARVASSTSPPNSQKQFLSPVWQISPIAQNMQLLMYDLYSNPNYQPALDQLFRTKQSTWTDLVQLSQLDGSSIQRPSTVLFTPVRPFSNQTIIAGTTAVAFTWDQIIAESLSSLSNSEAFFNLHLVLHTPSINITFSALAGQAHVLGWGDLHDRALENYLQTVNVSFVNAALSLNASANALKCPGCGTMGYKLLIYPTRAYRDGLSTNFPRDRAILVTFIAFFLTFAFMLNHYFQSFREQQLIQIARAAYSIVVNLYPSFVRTRLLEMHKAKNKRDENKTPNVRKQSVSGSSSSPSDSGHGPKITGMMNQKGDTVKLDLPIADSFDAVTVLFADLAGFTKWASLHQRPAEVFYFLETLYTDFDQAAQSLGVYKVETIGDCYMAVTGIIDKEQDHAAVMANFAVEILKCLKNVKLRMRNIGSVEQLDLRVGMHSGPCTAGVLRCDKGRFQLFGDTVNTASRMESNGIPGKIQISTETAMFLQNSIQFQFAPLILKMRPEKVAAKGKGELTTYWLEESDSKFQINGMDSLLSNPELMFWPSDNLFQSLRDAGGDREFSTVSSSTQGCTPVSSPNQSFLFKPEYRIREKSRPKKSVKFLQADDQVPISGNRGSTGSSPSGGSSLNTSAHSARSYTSAAFEPSLPTQNF